MRKLEKDGKGPHLGSSSKNLGISESEIIVSYLNAKFILGKRRDVIPKSRHRANPDLPGRSKYHNKLCD